MELASTGGTPRPRYARLPPPSRMRVSRARFPDAPPAWVIRIVLELRRALLWLADRVVPASVPLGEACVGIVSVHLLGAVARLGIADHLADGPLDAATLATRTHTDADALHRVLRALASRGTFALRRDGRFENNRASRALRGGRLHRTREWLLYVASASNLAAWADIDTTLRTGEGSFERVHHATVWEWFDAHPDERENFADAMAGLTVFEAPIVATIYPFAEVTTVCDVGGGRGTLLSELLIRHPHLRGVLCDGAGVLDQARVLMADRGVVERVQFAPGSFFDHVPRGSDAYLLKNVLHDWDDARCVAILRVCRAAMAPASRLLLVETLLERNQSDGFGPLADVQMMVSCAGGRERSRDEYARLLDAAGFGLTRVFASVTTNVLEARPR